FCTDTTQLNIDAQNSHMCNVAVGNTICSGVALLRPLGFLQPLYHLCACINMLHAITNLISII
ncbi:MAG: hypothetical protein RR576_12560, partial [Oscillospiraceae bacterium]